MRRIVCLLLLAVLSLLFVTGCCNGTEPPDSPLVQPTVITGGNKPSTNTSPGLNGDSEISVQFLPETVENPDNLPVLKWVCLMEQFITTTNNLWNDDAIKDVNQMLAERGMPFRIQFVMVTMDKTPQLYRLMDHPEASDVLPEILADADMIYGNLTDAEMQQLLTPITEYVSGGKTPSLLNAAVHENAWVSTDVDGEIYGVPATPVQPKSSGWTVFKDWMNAVGLTDADLSRNFWEMDKIFAQVYARNGNKPFLRISDDGLSQYARHQNQIYNPYFARSMFNAVDGRYQMIGSVYAVDYGGAKPTVVNILETDWTRNFQEAIIRYKDAGYVAEGAEATLCYERGFSDFPHDTTEEQRYIPVTKLRYDGRNTSTHVSGVSVASEYMEEAVKLLALITEDQQFQMCLWYGKEGRDYTCENGIYSEIVREDGSVFNLDFLSQLSYHSDVFVKTNRTNTRVPSVHKGYQTVAQEGMSSIETIQRMLTDGSVAYPVEFDLTPYKQELTDIRELMNAYAKFYTNHEADSFSLSSLPDWLEEVPRMDRQEYDIMLQHFKEAGSDRVLEGLQQQLDAWLGQNTK